MIYFDAAATTPVRREVLEAMWPWLTGEFGNPSSSHAAGHRAATALKQARSEIAATLNCRPGEIVFTSGGTEADNLAIKGIALATPRGRHIVTTAIEHEAVLASCDYLRRHHGFEITHLPVNSTGLVSPLDFEQALRPDTTLATIIFASNEVGTIQPMAELAAITQARAIPFHTDAVQAAGALPLDLAQLKVSALSLSGHKLGAPKGVGALYLRGGLQVEPILHGGGQERTRRSGTENVAAAVGLALALKLATQDLAAKAARLSELRDRLMRGVLAEVPTAILTGHPTLRLPNNASFCFPGTSGEAMLLALEERGILCSSGSACAAGRDEPSHVLLALGIAPEVAQTAVRFSLTDAVTPEEILHVVQAVRAARSALHA
jgi:cysteine desulfurase